MSAGSSNFPTVHNVVAQKREGVQKEKIRVNAPAEGLCLNNIATEPKGDKNISYK